MDNDLQLPLGWESEGYQMACAAVELLTGAYDSPVVIQTFDDARQDQTLVTLRYGPLPALFGELADLNARGAGVFFLVNESAGGRKKTDVARIRGVWADIDYKPLPQLPLPPTLLSETARGFQPIWRLAESINLDECERLNRLIAAFLQADAKAVDAARVMRIPGFWHLKDRSQPFQVCLRHGDPAAQYTRETIERAFASPSGDYGQAALTAEASKVRQTEEGSRNDQLNRSAFKVGQLVGDGRIDRARAEVELATAGAACGLEAGEIRPTLRSGLDAGQEAPRDHAGLEFFHSSPPRPIEWLVHRILARGTCSIVAGAQKVGKTFAVLDLALAVASGTKAFGRFPACSPGRVLLICPEGGPEARKRRLYSMCSGRGLSPADIGPRIPAWPGPINLTNDKALAGLRSELVRINPALLVIDPLITCAGGTDENDAGAMQRLLNNIRSLQVTLPTLTIVCVHHTGKGSGEKSPWYALRGSTALPAWSDGLVFVSGSTMDLESPRGVVVSHRDAEPPDPFGIRIAFGSPDQHELPAVHVEYVPEELIQNATDDRKQQIVGLVKQSPGSLDSKLLASQLRVSPRTIQRAVSDLEGQGVLRRDSQGKLYPSSEQIPLGPATTATPPLGVSPVAGSRQPG